MEDPKSAVVMLLDNEIVQVTAFNRTFFVTRQDFARLEHRSRRLEQVIFRGGGLSTIRQIFADHVTDEELEKRFETWREALSRTPDSAKIYRFDSED